MSIYTPISDEMESRARTVLSSCAILEIRRLKIEKIDGVLCLLGALPTWYHKQLAQEMVRRLRPEVPVPIRNLTHVERREG